MVVYSRPEPCHPQQRRKGKRTPPGQLAAVSEKGVSRAASIAKDDCSSFAYSSLPPPPARCAGIGRMKGINPFISANRDQNHGSGQLFSKPRTDKLTPDMIKFPARIATRQFEGTASGIFRIRTRNDRTQKNPITGDATGLFGLFSDADHGLGVSGPSAGSSGLAM